MGITERAVHINRVRPLLTDKFKNHTEPVTADWTPPLFNHEAEPEAITSESSSELQEGPTEGQASSPVVPEAAPSHVNPSQGTVVTTRRGRVVKPVQYYGHT